MSAALLVVNLNLDPGETAGCEAIAAALRSLDPSVETAIVPWREVGPRLVSRLRPRAVLLGPNGTPFPAYPPEFDRFLGWVRSRRGPTLGICGGHQALALAHGSPVGPVHSVPAATTTYEGMPKESGPRTIRLLGDPDPLLRGLPDEPEVAVSHVDEVKEVPPGFHLLAIGDPCHVQAMRADRRPLVGVQFHPERPPRPGMDDWAGLVLLRNWLASISRR
jgi:GMP synthase (glutamine-hydrolysing)